jgi:hypothetical protein
VHPDSDLSADPMRSANAAQFDAKTQPDATSSAGV